MGCLGLRALYRSAVRPTKETRCNRGKRNFVLAPRTRIVGHSEETPMPFAVALLCHPAGAYVCLVTALAAFVFTCHARSFVPAFTTASAAALTTLAFLQVPPDLAGPALLALGVALLQAELLVPTYGAALVAGCAACIAGSWRLLAAAPLLPPEARLAFALGGTALILVAVLRGFRLRTLGAR
jgi:membrane-bound serine protease (ClpP class)